MKKNSKRVCPECGDTVPAEPVNRRNFLKVAAGAAAAVAASPAFARSSRPEQSTEAMIKELYTGLADDQKKSAILPYDNANRLKLHNKALGEPIGKVYTKAQQELVERILKSMSSGEDGWRQLTRGGTWDASKSFEACGANLFGELGGKYAWVFSGHHLTIRCDGNTEEGPALGGPLYYGHTPNGYADTNIFAYQTRSALAVFESLTESQRTAVIAAEQPKEGFESVQFRGADKLPGLRVGELSKESIGLVEKVVRDLLSPYRKADSDEVMEVIKAKGGLEKLNMAFYKDKEGPEDKKRAWSFWRLEGSGFVWNFRVLPHVHTFVNISSKA